MNIIYSLFVALSHLQNDVSANNDKQAGNFKPVTKKIETLVLDRNMGGHCDFGLPQQLHFREVMSSWC